jgi:class 3 adenylate cyclase
MEVSKTVEIQGDVMVVVVDLMEVYTEVVAEALEHFGGEVHPEAQLMGDGTLRIVIKPNKS